MRSNTPAIALGSGAAYSMNSNPSVPMGLSQGVNFMALAYPQREIPETALGYYRAMPRVPMADFEPALKQRLEKLWGEPPNLYRGLGNHPKLVAAWTEFSKTLRHDTRTPRALRELVILRGAQLMSSEYEWAQHLKMARKCGVTEAQIAALADWKHSKTFNEKEKAALRIAEAVTNGRVGDEDYAE